MTDTGANNYLGVCYLNTGIAYVRAINSSGTYASQSFLSGTVPFTWGSGDFFEFNGVYEAAS